VRELESLLHASIAKLVTISLNLEEDLPPVLADEAQLQQVVMNLVINGAEAIPARTTGTVTITTRRRRLLPCDLERSIVPLTEIANEYVELSVHDTGCGMEPATQARIFEPFFTTKFAGRGLGLSSVLGIVSAHGGTMTLQSAPGEGSCFTVLLPAAPQSAQPKSAPAAQVAVAGSGTILVVDDEPAVREMSRCVLESSGYQVLTAADGLAAIQQVTEHPEIRAVLMDLGMPGMCGDTAASRVRELRPELPILLSSGYSPSEADRSSPESVCCEFLPKPYSPAMLLERIGRLVNG
jgi:CheY-like chemotaxis protein